jgi:hypothetical protein
MMFETYSNAEQVLACLGASDTHSEVILGAMKDLDMFVQEFPVDWENPDIPLDLDVWDPPLDETATAQLYDHYQKFSRRSYFTCLWVLQELAGGRNRTLLLCGQEISDWSDLLDLSLRFSMMYCREDAPYKGDHHSSIFEYCTFSLKEFHKRLSFPSSIMMLGNLQCQDVRDRIYSTHVLIDWSSFGQTPPLPDYRISPLELALQLVEKMTDTGLRGVAIIAYTLGLFNPSMIPQVRQELREHQQRTQSCKAPEARYRKWYARLHGAQMVQQDDTGRPIVQFDRYVPTSSAPWGLPNHINLSGLSEDMLAACKLIPLYDADGVFDALLSERVRPGDIIIHSEWFGLVLRPHGDGDKFVVVGRVLFSAGIRLAFRAPFADECDHHTLHRAHYQLEWVSIAIELSDVEALEVVVSGDNASNVDCNGPESLDRCTFGETKAGSYVWDVTAETMEDKYSIRKG